MVREQIVDGRNRQVTRVLVFGDPMPAANARSLDDPLVAGIEIALEIGVGQHRLRRVHAERRHARRSADDRARHYNRDPTASANARVDRAREDAPASSAVRAPAA